MHEMEDLQLNLMSEQIVPVLEDTNLVIKRAVLINVEMEENIYQKKNEMMRTQIIMTGEAQYAQLKMTIIVKMVQKAQRIIEINVEMVFT